MLVLVCLAAAGFAAVAQTLMVPSEMWGAVLLVNAMGYTTGLDLPTLGRNVGDLLLGRAVTPVGRTPLSTLWVVIAVQIVGMIHTTFVRWRRSAARRPRLGLPLIGGLALAVALLWAVARAWLVTRTLSQPPARADEARVLQEGA